METIKVNMNPNPLDVQTIHASQNDGEARQWGFELHNNGELIDTSDVKEQLAFKAYKGGTEQLLPENGSVPTTSPIIADIKYPQGLLTNQEFTYRQSPTEEDGLAKIQAIYGNTLVWNQLATFTPRSRTDESGITYDFKADGTIVFNGTATGAFYDNFGNTYQLQGHKLYIKGCPSGGSNSTYYLRDGYNGVASERDFGNGVVVTARANTILQIQILPGTTVTNLTFIPQLFDLTAMGLDSLTDAEVKQWFADYYPLPYYQYDSGSLLSFRGEGLKTVGFNQWDGETESGYIYNGTPHASNDYWRTKNYIPVIENETYYFNVPSTQGQIALYDANKNYVSSVNSIGGSSHQVTIPSGCAFARFYQPISSDSSTVCVNISSSRDGEYEPYTSSTLSLPISTYFPNGMASAKNAYNNAIVYDELTLNKAIKRLEQYTFTGNETVNGLTQIGTYYRCYLSLPIPSKGTYATRLEKNVPNVYNYTNDNSHYYVQNSQFWYFTTSSTAQAIRDELSGTKFYYDLSTPTETPFTTASLVTENAEIPLSNEDGVLIGKCTEQLSENPGFIDAKIKLSDADGTCYSNKIQLHVERKP